MVSKICWIQDSYLHYKIFWHLRLWFRENRVDSETSQTLIPLTLVPQCHCASDRMGTFVCLGHGIKKQDMIKSS